MELKRAKEVLEGMGLVDMNAKRIRTELAVITPGYARLDGHFSVLNLEAIATWMRDPDGVVGA